MNAKTINIVTNDYSKEYGGVPVIIDGHECSFGSVVGYALYNRACPIKAVERAKANGHDLHWINRSATVLCSDRGYYERVAARRAKMPKLAVGNIVSYEGRRFEIVRAPNSNYDLKPIDTNI